MEIFSSGFWLMSVFKAADSSCFVVSEVGYFMLIFPPGSRKMDGYYFIITHLKGNSARYLPEVILTNLVDLLKI